VRGTRDRFIRQRHLNTTSPDLDKRIRLVPGSVILFLKLINYNLVFSITLYWAFISWKKKRTRLFMCKHMHTFSLKYRFRSLCKSKERRRISAPVCLFLEGPRSPFLTVHAFLLFFQFKLSHCSFWAEPLRFGLVGGVNSVRYTEVKTTFSEGFESLFVFMLGK
jgi:hypothetical protein